MNPQPRRSRLASFVVWIPYAWLVAFFLLPFLIVLKISLSQSAIAQPPYTPVFDLSAGWRSPTSSRCAKAWAAAGKDSLRRPRSSVRCPRCSPRSAT